MTKTSIEQFRAAIAGPSVQGTLTRAYRELTRRPGAASVTRLAGWVQWPEPEERAASA
jgi:hypothetical protein